MQFLHDLVYVHQVAGIAPAEAQNDWFGPAYWAAFKAEQFVAALGPALAPGQPACRTSPTVGQVGGPGAAERARRQQADREFRRHRPVHHRAVGEPRHGLGPDRGRNLTEDGILFDFKARTVYPAYIPPTSGRSCRRRPTYFGGAKIGELYASVAPDLPPFNQSPYFLDTVEAMVRIVITPVMTDKERAEAALQSCGRRSTG